MLEETEHGVRGDVGRSGLNPATLGAKGIWLEAVIQPAPKELVPHLAKKVTDNDATSARAIGNASVLVFLWDACHAPSLPLEGLLALGGDLH
eukprot:9548262-Alexandrium_andersonii.AAC.1